jgi:hypothetical protein
MKSLSGILAGAAALMAIMAGAADANAAILTVTDFSANASGLTVTSTPADTLSAATAVSAASWTAGQVLVPLGGLATGDAVSLSNPIDVSVGSHITLSWDGGTFSDTLTTTGLTFSGDTLDLFAAGVLTGPGVPGANHSELDLAFTQAGGTGFAISGSGTYVASTTVPELSTWAMLGLGLAAIGLMKGRRAFRPA